MLVPVFNDRKNPSLDDRKNLFASSRQIVRYALGIIGFEEYIAL
jgi:hypothetical protein